MILPSSYFVPFFFPWWKKKQKDQGQTNAPLFVRPTHKHSEKSNVVCIIALTGWILHFVLCQTTEGADFSLAFFKLIGCWQKAKKRRWNYLPQRINKFVHFYCSPTEESPPLSEEDLGGGHKRGAGNLFPKELMMLFILIVRRRRKVLLFWRRI